MSSMSTAGLFALYSFIVIAICVLSFAVSYLANIWEHKSKLSSAILCGLIVGVVTGLPELIVNITSAADIYTDSTLGAGDVLGSNLLNFAFLGIGAIIFFRYFKKTTVTRIEMINMFSLLGIYILYALGFAFGDFCSIGGVFSTISIIAFIVWGVNVYFLTKSKKITISNHRDNFLWRLDIKKITLLFALATVLVIGAAVGTTFICNEIVHKLDWDSGFGGSIFASISTALPEIISCFALFYLRNPKAAISEMLGSSIFNIFTLFINDLITAFVKPPHSVYTQDKSLMWLSIFALIGGAFFLISLVLLKWKKRWGTMRNILVLGSVGLAASTYPIYIVVCLMTKIYLKT